MLLRDLLIQGILEYLRIVIYRVVVFSHMHFLTILWVRVTQVKYPCYIQINRSFMLSSLTAVNDRELLGLLSYSVLTDALLATRHIVQLI